MPLPVVALAVLAIFAIFFYADRGGFFGSTAKTVSGGIKFYTVYGGKKKKLLLEKRIKEFDEISPIDADAKARISDMNIHRSYNLARSAHADPKRATGEPYIIHPFAAALTVVQLGMDTDTVCAALLHDVVEDTSVTLDEIKKEFGEDVATMVDGVTKLSKIKFVSKEEAQAENVRKMMIAMAKDVRVIIVKLADRLHNMRTIDAKPIEIQHKEIHIIHK